MCYTIACHWRGVRVVEGDRLEICCSASYRGFESHPLRQKQQRLPGKTPEAFLYFHIFSYGRTPLSNAMMASSTEPEMQRALSEIDEQSLGSMRGSISATAMPLGTW